MCKRIDKLSSRRNQMFVDDEFGAKDRTTVTKFVRDLNKLQAAVEDLEECSRNLCACFVRMRAAEAFKTEVPKVRKAIKVAT